MMLLFGLLVLGSLFCACSDSLNNSANSADITLHSTQSDCLGGLNSPPGKIAKTTPLVWFYAGHDTLAVYHDSTYYNCGSHIAIFMEHEGFTIDFAEVDTLMIPMDCMCYFNVQATVAGLPRGTYTARLWHDDSGELLAEEELYVPGK